MPEDEHMEKVYGEDKPEKAARKEEPWDETTAMICGHSHPTREPIGRCIFCGGEVWPIEDECWDGAEFHYITFAYECYGCGHTDVWNFSDKGN